MTQATDEGDGRRRYDVFLHETGGAPLVLGANTTTVRLFQGRPVRVAELPAAAAFLEDGALPLPQVPGAGGGASALAVASAALRAAAGAEAPLDVVAAGHGADEALTATRARAWLALVLGDAAAWTAAALAAGDDRAAQGWLAWCATAHGWPCDPGGLDGVVGPKTRAPLRAFRSAWAARGGAAAPPDAPLGPEDWRAWAGAFDLALGGLLGGPDALAAARAKLRPACPAGAPSAGVGCGAHWPPDRVRIDDHAPAADARVDLLLFAAADRPKLACHAGPAAEPKRCDVYRKAKYRAVPLAGEDAPGIVRGLLRGLFFETDKVLLLPKAAPGLRRMKAWYERHPGHAILAVGHADTAGAGAHNLKLSVERADALAAYLRDDVDAWLAHYAPGKTSKPWGTREDQHMLSALPPEGPPFFAEPVDGVDSPRHRAAVEAFQGWANETRGAGLAVDGLCGPNTRRALVAAYMDLDGTTLPAGTTLLVHGCGEHHPEVPTGDGVAHEENRRAELFFFPGGVLPPPRDPCPAPGCPEYPVWRQQTTHTIDLTLEPGALDLVVVDRETDLTLGEADVTLSGLDARAGKTDADGRLRFDELFPGPYELVALKEGYREKRTALAVAPGASQAKSAPPAPPAAEPGGEQKAFVGGPAGEADAPPASAAPAAPAAEPPGDAVKVPLDPVPATLEVLVGAGDAPRPAGATPYAGVTFAAAKSAPVAHLDDARRLAADEEAPPPADVLALRANPGGRAGWRLVARWTPRGATKPREVELAREGALPPGVALAGGKLELHVLCTYGALAKAEAAPALAGGVVRLDLHDPEPDATDDHARQVAFELTGAPAVTLPAAPRRPRIVRFMGVAVPPTKWLYWKPPAQPKPSKPATNVVVHLGWTLRLEWTVRGPAEGLLLDPSGKAVPLADERGQLALDPAAEPPGAQGAYTLRVRRGGQEVAAATVTAVGIARLRLTSLDPKAHPVHRITDQAQKKHEVVDQEQGDALLGRAGAYGSVEPGGQVGYFMAGTADKPAHEGVWFGQVQGTLKPPVRLEWRVFGPDDLQVGLRMPATTLAPAGKPIDPIDVSEQTHAWGGEGELELTAALRPATKMATFLEVELALWPKDGPRNEQRRLCGAVLRLRYDRPLPAIRPGDQGLTVLDQADPLAAGGTLSAWAHLAFRWGLQGDHYMNRLVVRVCEPGQEAKDDPEPLWEHELKPTKSATSSGLTPVPTTLPPALKGKSSVVAVVLLVRPPTPAEEAKGAPAWVQSMSGAQGRRSLAFKLPAPQAEGTFPCVLLKETCPVNTALALRRKYLAALEHWKAVRLKWKDRLHAAYFVKAVVEGVTDPKAKHRIKDSDIWPNMLATSGQDGTQASGWSSTWLKADIDRMEAEIKAAQQAAEDAARALIEFITSPAKKPAWKGKSFQEHLIADAHTKHDICEGDRALAERLYGIEAKASYDPDKLIYRHVDHLAALFTDYLNMVEIGRTFLASLFDDAKLKTDLLAFDNVWDFAGKLNTLKNEAPLTAPIGKLVANVTHVTHFEVAKWSVDQTNAFIHKKLMPSGALKRLLGFLQKRVFDARGRNVQDILYGRAFDLSMRSHALKLKIAENKLTLPDVEAWSKTKVEEPDKLLGNWFNLGLDAVALAISLQKASQDWKGETWKNRFAVAKDLFGLINTTKELVEGAIPKNGALAAEAAAGGAGLATDAASLTKQIKVFGALAGLCQAVLSAMEVADAWESKDWDRIVLHSAAAVAALVGIVFPGIGALLAVGIAVLMMIVFDHPVVDWLEDTPWGEDHVWKPEDVIQKFYEAMYDVYVYLKETVADDANHDAIVVVSNLLANDLKIELAVTRGGKTEKRRIDLTKQTVDGKGLLAWPRQTVDGKRRFHLHRAWDVFPNIRRDGSDHKVRIELDPDTGREGPEMAADFELEFRAPPEPRVEEVRGHIWGTRLLREAGRLRQRKGARVADPWYIVVEPGQAKARFTVHTRYAGGCRLELELRRYAWYSVTGDVIATGLEKIVDATAGTEQPGAVETVVELTLPVPPADDDYAVRLYARVIPNQPEAKGVGERWTAELGVARAAYLDA